ncbi:MAG UNVERIFIED_CONTAM: hypothetical protein LVQ98_00960 [Rickettsiaceae bacterium]|jgi:hypothetical protein
MKDARILIANAIKNADKSYFWENYSKQADAVISALKAKNLAIVPLEPDSHMLKAGIDVLHIGKTKTKDLAEIIYKTMVKESCKER